MALSALNCYEFCATEFEVSKKQEEEGYSSGFKRIFKCITPNFSGNLPEIYGYYLGKDLVLTGACLLLPRKPVTIVAALAQGVTTAYNLYSGKYTDEVLNAIMLNHRYNSKQEKTDGIKKMLSVSMENLKYYLCNNYKILNSDSKIVKCAKQYYSQQKVST